jgi:hypothetical protein
MFPTSNSEDWSEAHSGEGAIAPGINRPEPETEKSLSVVWSLKVTGMISTLLHKEIFTVTL